VSKRQGWESGDPGQGPITKVVGCVEEAVRAAERRVDRCRSFPRGRPAAQGCPPQLSLELLDAVGELRRPAWSRDVGVGSVAGGEVHCLIGHFRQHRQDDPRVGKRGKTPWFGADDPRGGPLPARSRNDLVGRLFGGRSPLGDGVRRRSAQLRSLPKEIAQLGRAGRIGAKRTAEAVVDDFEVRKGRLGEEIHPRRGQVAAPHDDVEELPGPPHQIQKAIEFVEAAAIEVVHRAVIVPAPHPPVIDFVAARVPTASRKFAGCDTLPQMASTRTSSPVLPAAPAVTRRLRTAEILSVGSELLAGETVDTNATELSRELTDLGLRVGGITAVPDDLATVRDAVARALDRSDIVVSTGGLGPTPDDLTREAIAAVVGETPVVDPVLDGWLRDLWARREMAFPEINLKQAWLIPSSVSLANGNGTAPGWWVDRPDGRVVIALPGPPREMRAMWANAVLPRLLSRETGHDTLVRTYRLTGIGESQVADLLGELMLRSTNPVVATYARAEAVDVRISAVGIDEADTSPLRASGTAAQILASAEAAVLAAVGAYVWATGRTTWAEAVDAALGKHGWTLATVEMGTRGTLAELLADTTRLEVAESRATHAGDRPPGDLAQLADDAKRTASADVGVALRIVARGDDTAAIVGISTPVRLHQERRLAFLGGSQGRSRAAITAAAILLRELQRAGAATATQSMGHR
jgi:nicotinamide-nucleotide amidase